MVILCAEVKDFQLCICRCLGEEQIEVFLSSASQSSMGVGLCGFQPRCSSCQSSLRLVHLSPHPSPIRKAAYWRCEVFLSLPCCGHRSSGPVCFNSRAIPPRPARLPVPHSLLLLPRLRSCNRLRFSLSSHQGSPLCWIFLPYSPHGSAAGRDAFPWHFPQKHSFLSTLRWPPPLPSTGISTSAAPAEPQRPAQLSRALGGLLRSSDPPKSKVLPNQGGLIILAALTTHGVQKRQLKWAIAIVNLIIRWMLIW